MMSTNLITLCTICCWIICINAVAHDTNVPANAGDHGNGNGKTTSILNTGTGGNGIGDSEGVHEGGVECPASHSKWHDECADNKEQSPVDINTKEAEDSDLCVSPFGWKVDYEHKGYKVENNGHTLQITPVKQSDHDQDLTTNTNVIATFKNIFEEDDKHKEFCLAQYHFHWGDSNNYGSEHTINEHHYPLEVHFVHFACDDEDATDALKKHEECVQNDIDCDEDGHSLGVISILFEISNKDNPAFDEILSDKIVSQIGATPEEGTHSCAYAENANLRDLISGADSGGYYSYQGSLTTPPCFEIVRWFIMEKTSYVSEKQMEQFRKIKLDSTFFSYEHGNFRDIQRYIGDEAIKCNVDGNGKNGGDGNGKKGGDGTDISINGDNNIVIVNGNNNLNGQSLGNRRSGGNGESDDDEDNKKNTNKGNGDKDDVENGNDKKESTKQDNDGDKNGDNDHKNSNNGSNDGDKNEDNVHNLGSNPSNADNNNIYSSQTESDNNDLVISLSQMTLVNIWSIAIAIIFVNVLLFYCYSKHKNLSKTLSFNNKYERTDVDEPNI